jgi:hypothetical protein
MADNKSGRDKQAHDERKRQLERDMLEQRERGDETEPPVDPETLDEFERELATIEFPTTAETVVAELGDWEIDAADSTFTVEELLPESDAEVLPDPETVRLQVQRPTVARAMKLILEAARELSDGAIQESQRDAYEKTFRALKQIDADDDDEGIRAITDWVLAYIDENQRLPGSREVRREGANFCRENGYQVRNDEWLGI